MKKLSTLQTRRQTWHNVELYGTAQEATAQGFALMYDDERGTVYGIRSTDPDSPHTFARVAFVPDRGHFDDYDAQAVEAIPSRAEIAEQIKQNAAEVAALKKEEREAVDKWRAMMEEDHRAALLTPRELRPIRRAHLEQIAHILRHNYGVALAAEVLPELVAILKKYDGKKASEKISNELKATAAAVLRFDRVGNSVYINIYDTAAQIVQKVQFYNFAPAPEVLDEQNTIHAPNADELRTNCGEYIPDPAARLDEINAAKQRADELRAAYNKAADEFNALTVDGFDRLQRVY